MNWKLLIKSVCCGTDDSDEENEFAEDEELGDKDMDASFMESYTDALNKELSSTTLERSFARAPRTGNIDEVTFVYFSCCLLPFLNVVFKIGHCFVNS